MAERHLIIFDGVCVFCNGAVQFIIQRDPAGKFAFVPLQSDLAQEIIDRHDAAAVDVDTFLLIKGGRVFVRSDAALEIARDLTGAWRHLRVLRFLPQALRDSCYRLLARNRYRLFGRREECLVPTDELRDRFL